MSWSALLLQILKLDGSGAKFKQLYTPHDLQRKTTEQFIDEAKKVHGDKYDYSKVKYINEKFSSLDLSPMEKSEILNEYLSSNDSFSEIKERIDKKYNELVNKNKSDTSIEKLKEIMAYIDLNVYLNDNNILIDLKDIDELRKYLKTTSYYNITNDSLTYTKDGNDYGFHINIDNTIINISPVLFSKNSTYIFEWNNDRYRIKRLNITNRNELFTKEVV